MGSTAFIFPGQGAQYVGMGKEFYDNFEISKNIFDRANEALGFDLKKLCFEGPQENLSITNITQPAILTASIAIFEVLKNRGISYDAMGGLSLGEYTALSAAGAIDFESSVKLVYKRGTYMQEEVPIGKGGLLVLIGGAKEDAVKLCQHVSENCGVLEPANFNCPGQTAVGGSTEAIDYAMTIYKDYNIKRAMKLDVSAPFHTSMLKGAGIKLRAELDKIKFNTPTCSVVSNFDVSYYSDKSQMPIKLEKQVYNPIRWEDCIKKMINDGVGTFVEIGPGKTLCGFIKKIDKDVDFYNIENIETLNKFLEVNNTQ